MDRQEQNKDEANDDDGLGWATHALYTLALHAIDGLVEFGLAVARLVCWLLRWCWMHRRGPRKD